MNNYNFELVHACSFIGLNLSFFLFSCCLCPSNRWHIELHFFICGSFFWLSAFWNMNMISFLFGIVFSPALFIVPFEIIIFMIRFNTEHFSIETTEKASNGKGLFHFKEIGRFLFLVLLSQLPFGYNMNGNIFFSPLSSVFSFTFQTPHFFPRSLLTRKQNPIFEFMCNIIFKWAHSIEPNRSHSNLNRKLIHLLHFFAVFFSFHCFWCDVCILRGSYMYIFYKLTIIIVACLFRRQARKYTKNGVHFKNTHIFLFTFNRQSFKWMRSKRRKRKKSMRENTHSHTHSRSMRHKDGPKWMEQWYNCNDKRMR